MCLVGTTTDALVEICAYALNAGVCTALRGMAPGCGPSSELLTAITDVVGGEIISTAITCASYQLLKQSMCNGVAMSSAEILAASLLGDPYGQVCSAGVSCSCGTCPFLLIPKSIQFSLAAHGKMQSNISQICLPKLQVNFNF